MKILLNPQELEQLTAHAPVLLECFQCHNTFYKPKNEVKAVLKHNGDGDRKYGRIFSYCFCSSKCASKAKERKIKTKCLICQKEIERTPSRIKKTSCCSQKCAGIYYGILSKKEKPMKLFRKVKTTINNVETTILIPRKRFIPKILINKNCSFCQNPILRSEKSIKKSKTQTFFCNKSCKTKYLHKFQIKHKPRSKAEKYLVELIRKRFPLIEIQENIRTILSNNLEIDIYLPDLKLAIELNGPVHYFPIWGQEKLNLVQNKDIQKQIEISRLGLNLMVVDISKLNSNKKTMKFLDEYFVSHIIPILQNEPPIGDAPISSTLQKSSDC